MDLTLEEFRKFETLIYQISGIRLQESKQSLLTNRLRRRLKALGLADFKTYYRLLSSPEGSSEMAEFLNVVTTNETSFFRTEKHFEWLRTEFLPECIRDATRGLRSKRLRIWSAASSTGEEAYSIALCLAENQLRLGGWQLEIVGTDISEDVLQRAREGVYKTSSLEGMDEKQLRRYFTAMPDHQHMCVKPALANQVTFKKHNLLNAWTAEPFDCIFLRNVLIYFDRASKAVVLRHIRNALSSRGFLVLGPSEGVFDMLDGFEKVNTFLYRKQD
ncbi:CheR family methyltransferase [Planctomicrobium piriforme]|uniref:protein-glutamate O-methyltransferase n=1 Tax=Planctomicrobium piriforme TaxID=1576369 RepID=A0A1I3CJA6_9PLAN|nr:protein-glutamate O-methyltransferase CheR [Planctomicrobium piriforme]SFH74555.1 chemotaxis protein methyltransferase CheR [Planctomicrobium piriforme]